MGTFTDKTKRIAEAEKMIGKRKLGRPSIFTPELGDAICVGIANGRSLRRVCAKDGMPHRHTVLKWLRDTEKYKSFIDQYARAREQQAWYWADQIIDIADDGRNDTYTAKDGTEQVNYDHIQRSKLRVDTRKWYVSKVLPKVYGDRLTTEHTGPGGVPVQVAVAEVKLPDFDLLEAKLKEAMK